MADQKNQEKHPRPVPVPTPLTQPFWDAARQRRLALQFDRRTGRPQFWPRPVSVYSGRREMDWREVSGRGTLYSWTVVHVPVRGLEDLAPYIVAAVDLDEGARVAARLVNASPKDLSPGMKVRIAWEPLSETINMYVFEPDV
jgi:uncharacterized OB-fold protein